MPRGLDHIVHAVRDLEAGADLYRRLGFTVGARNRHPWGTHNHVIQLPGFFVELLTVVEPEKLGSDGFSINFGRFNQSFLARREGLSFLLLESTDAASDALSFQAAGIAASEALRFERKGTRPDGTKVRVGFSVAFARDRHAPEIGFGVCQHRFPENFWNAVFQRHIFLSAFTGERELHATSSGITASTPRGDIKVMDAAAFANHFGVAAPDISGGARLAALRFHVRDRGALLAALAPGGITYTSHMNAIVVGAEAAMGATLIFEPA